MNPRKKLLLFISLTLVLFLSLGCAFTNLAKDAVKDVVEENLSEVQEGVEGVIEQAEEIVGDAVESETAPENGEEQPAMPSGDLQLPFTITENDFSHLTNYRIVFIMDVIGSDGEGYDMEQHIEMHQSVINEPYQLHEKIIGSGTGVDANMGTLEFFMIDDQTYIYYAEDAEADCFSVSGGEENFEENEFFRPEDFFESIELQELVEQGVMVNGTLCDHYMTYNTGFEMSETHNEKADVWIAKDGGHIVRFTGVKAGVFADDEISGDGQATWSYDLLDVGQVGTITLPQECLDAQSATEDIPVPDNAEEYSSFAGIISFTSPDTSEDVGEYYKNELAVEGWSVTEEGSYGGLVMMSAVKGEDTIQVMITGEDSGGCTVLITNMGAME